MAYTALLSTASYKIWSNIYTIKYIAREKLVWSYTMSSTILFTYYIPINVLLEIQSVPSSAIQTSGLHFPYHHSLIFRIRIMPVWCDTALHKQLNVIQPSRSTHCSGVLYISHTILSVVKYKFYKFIVKLYKAIILHKYMFQKSHNVNKYNLSCPLPNILYRNMLRKKLLTKHTLTLFWNKFSYALSISFISFGMIE